MNSNFILCVCARACVCACVWCRGYSRGLQVWFSVVLLFVEKHPQAVCVQPNQVFLVVFLCWCFFSLNVFYRQNSSLPMWALEDQLRRNIRAAQCSRRCFYDGLEWRKNPLYLTSVSYRAASMDVDLKINLTVKIKYLFADLIDCKYSIFFMEKSHMYIFSRSLPCIKQTDCFRSGGSETKRVK